MSVSIKHPFVLAVGFGLLYACLIMAGWAVIKTFFEQASGHGYKSTVMKSLAWMVGLLFFGCLAAFPVDAPLWFCIPVAILLCLAILLYLGVYAYCMVVDRDALRLER
jgi:hypothetical protein